MAGEPTLDLGDSGAAVKEAQQHLICRYYLPDGTDDGIFGPVTLQAVRSYQTDRAAAPIGFWGFSFPLAVDGIIGKSTWFRLDPPQIQKGSKGPAVMLCQEILNKYGYTLTVDSDFGPLTDTAVKAFQQTHFDHAGAPLKVDGIVGLKTWCALWS
jgi:peptidoglycan hydrolase-like protein with peptidoglycan-binding domain